uniref:Ankyrin repeat and SOCS box protein 11 n=1 Tax=Mastacembelus armatus TaxID=205130 RepID=A0A7N8XI51_9TELE
MKSAAFIDLQISKSTDNRLGNLKYSTLLVNYMHHVFKGVHHECLGILSEHGDFPDLVVPDSWSDRTPLHEAAYQGRLLHLRTLIAQGFHVDTLTMDRVSPLHEACLGGHYGCAKFLLDNGANVRTPLHAAVRGGGANIVDLLLDFGADGYCRNAEGKAPLDLSTPNSAVRTALQKRGPCPLSQLCRFCIRRSLGRKHLHRASSLSLPHSIKEFLLHQ